MALGKRKRTSNILAFEALISADDDVLAPYRTQIDILFRRLSGLACPLNGVPPSPSTEGGEDESSRSQRATSATPALSAGFVAQEQAASIPSGPDGLFLPRLLEICRGELPFFVDALEGTQAHATTDTEDPRITIIQSIVGIPEEETTGIDECRKLLIDRSFTIEYKAWAAARGSLRKSLKRFSQSRSSFTRSSLIECSIKRGNRFRDFEKLLEQPGIAVLCCFHYSTFTKLASESRKSCASYLRSPLCQPVLHRAEQLTPILKRNQDPFHLRLGLSLDTSGQSLFLYTRLRFAVGG